MKRKKYTGKMDSTMGYYISPTDFDMSRRTMADIAERIIRDMAYDKRCYENLKARERQKEMDAKSAAESKGETVESESSEIHPENS